MGSPIRSRPSGLNLHRSERNRMRLGSPAAAVMEPCVDSSPSKEESKKIHNTDAVSGTEPSNTAAVLSPKAASSPGAAGSSSSSPSAKARVHAALHDGLDGNSSSHTGSNNSSDKLRSHHSAASSRTRRPFFLHRLSSNLSSKQRRESKKKQKENEFRQQEEPQERHGNSVEGRHPEEPVTTVHNHSHNHTILGRNESEPLANVSSPASTVHSSKSNTSGKRRKGKPGIRFLKRALSSPPILRFHSSSSNNPADVSDWYHSSRRRLLPHNHSSSSSSSNNSSGSVSGRADARRNVAQRTRVVPKSFSPTAQRDKLQRQDEEEEAAAVHKAHCTATSILHHSYFPVMETLCGIPPPESGLEPKDRNQYLPDRQRGDLQSRYYDQHPHPHDSSCFTIEDPTVQESIECIFASQLEDGLKLWDEEYDDDGDDDGNAQRILNRHAMEPVGHRSFESLEKVRTSSSTRDGLVSPAGVQQSRMNRKDRRDSSKSLFANMSQTKKRYDQASLVYVGTFDPNTPRNRVPSSTRSVKSGHFQSKDDLDASTVYSNLPTDPLPCACATSFLPSVEPKDWPQAPIALRPTPGSGTTVKAIRFSQSSEPLWVPGSHMTWSQRLEEYWGKESEQEQRRKRDQQPHYACCEHCVLLPINNGNEAPGESLVIDFESELFEGTFMLRLRYSEGTTPEPYDDGKGYFKGMNRRYQACVRGRFKKAIPFTELTTGVKLDRKFGKLPSKWMIKGALKVVSFFAPQLDIKFEGTEQPYSITPLGSTPQCINVDDEDEGGNEGKEFSGYSSSSSSEEGSKPSGQPFVNTIEHSNVTMNPLDGIRVESSEARRSILGIGVEAGETTSLQRAKMRKKAFDKLYVQKSQDPKTDPSKIYTFEFLQHMLNFQDFTIELGNMLGSLKLEDMLDGQPLPIMACHGDKVLWSFDIWNECLWEQAKKHDAIARQTRRQQVGWDDLAGP